MSKFLADRGTHLAAMIAYFALLSFVPLLFLALSLVALGGQQSESSYLVEELRRAFPASSVDRLLDVVRSIQEQATSLSIIGGIGLLWAALGFFSVLSYVYALAVSTALIFGLTWTLYYLLTNAALTWRETFPGALFAAVLLQVSFQALPLFIRLTTGELVALQAFGGLVLLLVWLYLMANVLVFGAEINWWLTRGRVATTP
jgi:uncharacterized BrkB/YihY/UPF0761 family membrane protein